MSTTNETDRQTCKTCGGTREMIGLFPKYADDVPMEERKPAIKIPCPDCTPFTFVTLFNRYCNRLNAIIAEEFDAGFSLPAAVESAKSKLAAEYANCYKRPPSPPAPAPEGEADEPTELEMKQLMSSPSPVSTEGEEPGACFDKLRAMWGDSVTVDEAVENAKHGDDLEQERCGEALIGYIDQLRSTVSKLEGERDAAKGFEEIARKEVARLLSRDTLAETQAKLSAAERRVAELTDEVDNLNEMWEHARCDFRGSEAELAAARSQIGEKDRELSRMKFDFQTMQGQITYDNAAFQRHRETLAEKDAEIERLQERLFVLPSKGENDAHFASLTAQVSSLQAQLAEAGRSRVEKEVARLIEVRAVHRSGTSMHETPWLTILGHLKGEVQELDHAISFGDPREDVEDELGDVLGVFVHAVLRAGFTMRSVEDRALAKFKQRFTEPSTPPAAGEVERQRCEFVAARDGTQCSHQAGHPGDCLFVRPNEVVFTCEDCGAKSIPMDLADFCNMAGLPPPSPLPSGESGEWVEEAARAVMDYLNEAGRNGDLYFTDHLADIIRRHLPAPATVQGETK